MPGDFAHMTEIGPFKSWGDPGWLVKLGGWRVAGGELAHPPKRAPESGAPLPETMMTATLANIETISVFNTWVNKPFPIVALCCVFVVFILRFGSHDWLEFQ